MQLRILDELGDNLLLQSAVSFFNGEFYQVRRVLVHREARKVAEEVVIKRPHQLIGKEAQSMLDNIVAELVRGISQ